MSFILPPYIYVNRNGIVTVSSNSVSVGTAAVSTRGFGAHEMVKIAEFIKLAATDYENNIDYIRNGVTEVCDKFPLYKEKKGDKHKACRLLLKKKGTMKKSTKLNSIIIIRNN